MKPSPIRRLRRILNVIAIILATLGAQQIYLHWKKTHDLKTIVALCELPEPPSEREIHHTFYQEEKSGYVFISFSLSASMNDMDAWLEKLDTWQDKRPYAVRNVTIRESESESRIDFSAEYAGEGAGNAPLISQKHDILARPDSK